MSRNDERASKEMYEQRTAMLPFPIRQELVGKRFILITEETTRRSAKNRSLENYSWKQGYIRACSVKDLQDKELQVLVEFDGLTWEYRKWIKIYEQTKAFFVENTIIWAARVFRNGNNHRNTALSWPALIFVSLVDYLGLDKDSKHPVEYFGDKQLAFLKDHEVTLYKESEENLKQVYRLNVLVQEDLTGWKRLQKTQACLMNGAETLTGARVTVYRLELRQWYTGCITSHNLTTRELHVMDDNVLQTHSVHPALVQINLMANDEELVRMLHGEQIKMLPTRRQRSAQIYFQPSCPEQKSQEGVTNWHMVTNLNAPQPKPAWSRPSVVRTVPCGEPAFVPSVAPDLDGSLLKQGDLSSDKDENHEETCAGHSATKVKVHKPVPVVLKRSDSIPFPHYAPQPSRSSTSPLLSLNSTPSPRPSQFPSSPLSSQHAPSPPSLKNQTSPQNFKNESPFNISLCDQSSARAAADRARNHESHRANHSAQNKPTMPSRKSNVTETDKNITNSRLVSSPGMTSPSTEVCPTSKNSPNANPTSFNPIIETTQKTPPQVTARTKTSESLSEENLIGNISPERSGTHSTTLTKSSQNFVSGVETQQKKKSPKSTPPNLVTDNLSTVDISSVTQQHSTNTVISPERAHPRRVETERARSSSDNGSMKHIDTNPLGTQTDQIQSRGSLYGNTQECSHLRTIAKIQLDYLLYLEELVRFQHKMIVEAVNTLNLTVTEEQFLFVADYFCKLVERNRNTENIFREASLSQQERQRLEHQRHQSQGTDTSSNRVAECLSEEISTKLRLAHESVSRKREEVMSILLPLEEWQQKKEQQKEWEVLKQRLQKQNQVDERRPAPRQGQAEAEKQSNLSGRQQQEILLQQQDKVEHQRLSGISTSSGVCNQVEISKEMRISDEQKKKAREKPQQTSTVESRLNMVQSPPQDRVLLATARSELSPQNIQHLQTFKFQREQLYEQKRYEEVQKKMVDELFQMKDVEQKAILLQHIVQALRSQKASSRDVLKSPPTISTNFGNKSMESQLTKVQTKQSQHVVPREVTADQLLSSLTTSPAMRRVTETLGIAPVLISEKQSTFGNTYASRNLEICNPEVMVEKEISTSGNTSIPDVTAIVDTSCETGSKKDKTGSATTSDGAKRRKTSLPDEFENLLKPKRQRKSTKKKSVSDISFQGIGSLDAPCQSGKQERIPVKSVPPGKALPMVMTSSDRNVTPVKANDEQFNVQQYHPRSITKGIGFVPINPVHGVNTAVTTADVTSVAGDSLDVLASVSTSLRKNERSVIQSFVGKNRTPNEEQQQSSGDSPTVNDGKQQLAKKNREFGHLSPTSFKDNQKHSEKNQQHNAIRKDSESFLISADRTQIADVVASHITVSSSQSHSNGRQSLDKPNQPVTAHSAEINQGGFFSDLGEIKISLMADQVKARIPPNFMVEGETVDSVGLNSSVQKPKKTKKERQKKQKKPKTQQADSTVDTTAKTNDGLSVLASNIARDMSPFYPSNGERNINGNKSHELLSKLLSSTHGDESRMKQTIQEVNALSLDHSEQDGKNSATVNSTEAMMKVTNELRELQTLKHLVPGSVMNTDILKLSTELEGQDSPKPIHPTKPLNLYNGKASTDETLAFKEKAKIVEISSSKKSGKQESKVKPDGTKSKKASEKKLKTSRANKQEKEKSTKKSSKVSTKNKETDNERGREELANEKSNSDDVDYSSANNDAIETSSSDETTMLFMSKIANDANQMLATLCTNDEFTHNEIKVNSLEESVTTLKDSKKAEDKTKESKLTQREDNTEDLSSILHKSVNSDVDSSKESIHTKEDDTSFKNTSEKHSVSEVTRQKNKTGASKSHNKKSANEKSKKNQAKEERSTKTKKPAKKSETNNHKSLENKSTKAEIQAGTVCVIDKNSMEVDEEIVVDDGEQKSLKQEQTGNERNSITTDGDVTEKRRNSEDIVFINDQSVGNFVKAKKTEDAALPKSLSRTKRKRCTSPQGGESVVSESSDVESCVPAVLQEMVDADSNEVPSKKTSSKKSSEINEKKETKVRKKKVKTEDVEEKNESETMDTLDESKGRDEKTDTTVEAKKKIKKAKNSNEKKVRERTQKEEWVYFLQKGGCKALPSMPQCRECRNYETEEEAILNKSCCRFHMFRRCRSKSNKLEMAGFSSSELAHGDDLLPWIAGKDIRKLLSLHVSKYILLNVGDEFCNLVQQEEKAFSWETKKDTIAWKRAVRGIREMCDACATTIFNVHWVCPKCGFGVCLDCYKARMEMSVSPAEAGRAKRFLWVRCSSNTSHRPQRLVLTHIIPKKTLHEICAQLHEAREFWGIGKNCPCKRKELEDTAKIKELSDDDKNIVVGEKPSLLEEDKDKVHMSVEVNSEVSMEVKSERITEVDSKTKTTNETLMKTEIKNSTETVMPDGQSYVAGSILPESQAGEIPDREEGKQPEVEKSKELDGKCQPGNSTEGQAPECEATTLPECQNISPACEKVPANDVDKQPECKDNEPPNANVERSSDVNIVGSGIGALSLLMDYESPVSSPVSSPVREMICEDTTEITPVEEALLSRPCATHGESSAMTSTSSETVGECSTNADIGSEGQMPPERSDGSSEMTSEPSEMPCETSAVMEQNSVMTQLTLSVTGETSAMTDTSQAEIIARVEARTTDEIPAPHSWICRRPMLRLHSAHHEGNLVAFQSRWQKGEPVLVSGVHKNMTNHLWTPEGFENEFGSEKADVVNCKTGGTLEKMDIGTFWRGFESVKDRPLDNKGEPTLLKLKDWPPEADFVEKMPTRFKDLMDALPLPEYTSREGTRNLVSRLPDFFVKPDLGPKMYNAYGNAAFPSAGTTNLHIDMSDAVNVMVYVGVPFDKGYGEQERRDSVACVDVACDETQQYRARGKAEKLGALWHIFAAEDANKIRALFHKVCREKNMKYPASHDPIHDQCFYLDESLLKRLKDEYGVVGWPIAQFLGDAIFIPAGAPHQVRNLHSCVKAAEDFVSPEHVGHCFKLTEEFRHLSEKHTNHEDKLQVKNIIYHAVKDAVSVLRQHEVMPETDEASNKDV